MKPHTIALLDFNSRRASQRLGHCYHQADYPALLTRTTVIFAKPSSKSGALSFSAMRAHHLFAHRAIARAVALEANVERHIEEDRLHLVAEALGHLDPLAALVDGEVGCVHVVPRHLGDEARAQQRAQRGKDQALVALLLDVVEEDVAQQIAGEAA